MITAFDVKKLDWGKGDGLLPAIIQDARTLQVLMLGYMNTDSLTQTLETGKVTFFSRTKQRLWMKGETSGNVLTLQSIAKDCDDDTILIKAIPQGPTCHKGTQTCFGEDEQGSLAFLSYLGEVIHQRRQDKAEESYTASLFAKGIEKISQKVGEEGVELSLAHMGGNQDNIKNEAADLIFHTMVLLESAGLSLVDICKVLQQRHK